MFLSLVSGSSGNASLIQNKNTTILVDCGLSGKRLSQMLDEIGISCSDIDAMLITHEHSDHTLGAGVISRRFDIPIYATEKTHSAMSIGVIKEGAAKLIKNNSAFEIGDIGIQPFSISHDAADPVGYCFYCDNKKYSLATDTGVMTETVFTRYTSWQYIGKRLCYA